MEIRGWVPGVPRVAVAQENGGRPLTFEAKMKVPLINLQNSVFIRQKQICLKNDIQPVEIWEVGWKKDSESSGSSTYYEKINETIIKKKSNYSYNSYLKSKNDDGRREQF